MMMHVRRSIKTCEAGLEMFSPTLQFTMFSPIAKYHQFLSGSMSFEFSTSGWCFQVGTHFIMKPVGNSASDY
jgi:hypothetical protein